MLITGQTSPFACSGRPILRIGRFVIIHGDSERSVVEFAAYVYFVFLLHDAVVHNVMMAYHVGRRKFGLSSLVEIDSITLAWIFKNFVIHRKNIQPIRIKY
uniref:Uncharacterized protein n=1 Tax=Romanomermis culicivorax TaxID=13658 RepID=A0A915HKN1_ROMCU